MFQLLAHSLRKRNLRVYDELLKYTMDWIMHLGNYKPYQFYGDEEAVHGFVKKRRFCKRPFVEISEVLNSLWIWKECKKPSIPMAASWATQAIPRTLFKTAPESLKLIFSLSNVLRHL